jgi:hypothetical protein
MVVVEVVACISHAGVGAATELPATSALGGSKTKFAKAESQRLHVDHAGTMSRICVGMARMGLKSDQMVEH